MMSKKDLLLENKRQWDGRVVNLTSQDEKTGFFCLPASIIADTVASLDLMTREVGFLDFLYNTSSL